jgi:hypothetical protein
VPRDRRWDFLHDVRKQPIKGWIVERLADELARDLRSWPPPDDWLAEGSASDRAAALTTALDERALRQALQAAQLDLARDFEGAERVLADDAARRAPSEAAAKRLVARWIVERCLALKEEAEGAHLTRADLADALRRAEQLLFRVTA